MEKKKIKLKIGDRIEVISGKYKGKKGIIKKILLSKYSLIIENLNLKTKNIKPKTTEEKGTQKKIESHIHISNIKKYIEA